MKLRKTVVGAVIVDSVERPTRIAAARRTGRHAGYWEFPGGKVEPSETPEVALVREIAEELGADIAVVREITNDGAAWLIGDELVLRLYLATVSSGTIEAGDSHDQVDWLGPAELDRIRWLPTDATALPAVRMSLKW